MRGTTINIVGAGLAGPLLAILLARRGLTVRLFERRSDPRAAAPEAGRSINLALAARGIRALERAGVMERVRPLLIAMRGRMLHEVGRTPHLLPYGQRDEEVIFSVGRAALNRLLIEEAARLPGVALGFDQACEGICGEPAALAMHDRRTGRHYELDAAPTIAADGAGSAVRTGLAQRGAIRVREEPLEHDYKELALPPRAGRPALEPHALHVWPRHGFMLIALPNPDASFTATLFLPRTGPLSFAALGDESAVRALFAREFPDAEALVPDLAEQFRAHPQGHLGTVHASPWHLGDRVLLVGDAAHPIVPFHGQGMNAAFEDCAALDALIDRHEDWGALFAEFESARCVNAAAIARMAVENYAEMRERVLDPKFLRQQAWARELEGRFPNRFIPRYAMVMFHPEIPYAEALRRGLVEQEILDLLDQRAGGAAALDHELARRLIEERL